MGPEIKHTFLTQPDPCIFNDMVKINQGQYRFQRNDPTNTPRGIFLLIVINKNLKLVNEEGTQPRFGILTGSWNLFTRYL